MHQLLLLLLLILRRCTVLLLVLSSSNGREIRQESRTNHRLRLHQWRLDCLAPQSLPRLPQLARGRPWRPRWRAAS
jgi:hypothetical protein